MPAGLGGFDARGVWQYGELDSEALASDMLNKGQASTSDAIAADRTRILALENRVPAVGIFTLTDANWSIVPTYVIKLTRDHDRRTLFTFGFVTSVARASGAVVGQLPAGFRPINPRFDFVGNDNAVAVTPFIIRPNGNMEVIKAIAATGSVYGTAYFDAAP